MLDWTPLTKTYLDRAVLRGMLDDETLTAGRGFLTEEQIAGVFGSLGDETSVLRTGDRLVLFAEFSSAGNASNKSGPVTSTFFGRLPERVGVVFSGLPENYCVPEDDPHFLELDLPNTDAPEEEVARYALSSFHSDLPAEKDELDVERYGNAIARFVLHPQTNPPLTFGIYGAWGKGKSSFMKLIDIALTKYAEVNVGPRKGLPSDETRTQRLNDLQFRIATLEPQVLAASANSQGPDQVELDKYKNLKKEETELWKSMQKEAARNVISVTFNAWQFEDSKQIWAGLTSQISKRLERELPWHSQQLLRISYAWKERRTELLLNILLPLAVFFLVVGLFSVGYLRDIVVPPNLGSLGGLLQLLLPVGSVLLTMWFFSAQVLKVAKPVSERVLNYVSLPNYRDQMGFQHRVMEDLDFIFKFFKNRRKQCKVVIYIDDLDRCSETKIMEILQAINLILANCKFFVFVGMNMEIIERAIQTYYKDKAIDDLAEYYLSKIIQISFDLPTNSTLGNYVSSLFSPESRYQLRMMQASKAAADQPKPPAVETIPPGGLFFDLGQVLSVASYQSKEVEDTPHELKAFCDYSDFLENNPRKVLRLINTHRLIKILLQHNKSSWSVDRQRKLVIWRIFCDKWPHLTRHAIASARTEEKNCLLDAITRWEEAQKKDAKSDAPAPDNSQAKMFAEWKLKDALSSRDIDEDFETAAWLMERVN